MVTERVRHEARTHFGCDRLEGAELENQGGDGTAMTHWEKRLFENEAMTGTHTQNPVYSRITLALMEDSGWYRANYSIAERLHWGHKLGCSFAMKSCGGWIREKLKKNESTAPFCADIKHDGSRSLATTRCTDQRDSLALCNLVPYKRPLPIDYRNFAHLRGVRPEGTKYYGGSVELADFCPYNQEFEWRAMNSTDRRDSRCELDGNGAPDAVANAVLETYGHGSQCFDLASHWTERKCGRIRTYSQFMAGCYAFVCSEGRLHLRVHNSSLLYTCFRPGQTVHIRRIVDGWLREGQITCPPCEEMCPAQADKLRPEAADLHLRRSPGRALFRSAFEPFAPQNSRPRLRLRRPRGHSVSLQRRWLDESPLRGPAQNSADEAGIVLRVNEQLGGGTAAGAARRSGAKALDGLAIVAEVEFESGGEKKQRKEEGKKSEQDN
uniref:Leishmanolysin-like peptidase n=1 Tax=Globodera rostochiensis TaxID=31243 RepID=A0A914GTQ9_GLORO